MGSLRPAAAAPDRSPNRTRARGASRARVVELHAAGTNLSPRLLIATTNPAKLAEYRILLRGWTIELASPKDLGIIESPAETGATFAANALIKARYYFARAKIPTLADDGGLEVDALGGEPGVRSHRWLGYDADDAALANEVVRRMAGVPPAQRAARLRAAVAIVYAAGTVVRERLAEAALEGTISERVYTPIQPGFPYRSVLWLPDRGCPMAAIGEGLAAQLSQRKVALAELHDALDEIACGALHS